MVRDGTIPDTQQWGLVFWKKADNTKVECHIIPNSSIRSNNMLLSETFESISSLYFGVIPFLCEFWRLSGLNPDFQKLTKLFFRITTLGLVKSRQPQDSIISDPPIRFWCMHISHWICCAWFLNAEHWFSTGTKKQTIKNRLCSLKTITPVYLVCNGIYNIIINNLQVDYTRCTHCLALNLRSLWICLLSLESSTGFGSLCGGMSPGYFNSSGKFSS